MLGHLVKVNVLDVLDVLESGNGNVDRRTDKKVWIWLGKAFLSLESRNSLVWRTDKWTKPTNEQTELHQFRKQLSYDDDLSSCHIWIQLDKAFLS